MVWKWTRLIILLIITGTAYFIGQIGLPFLDTPIPAIGKLFNPYTGFLQNNTKQNNFPEQINLEQLRAPVEILWDERKVPHIFADNNYDLYFTQGYLTAKDRLWQMDFTSRVSSGRIAEIVGEKAADFDQFHRRIGLPYSAKLTIDSLKAFPEEFEALQAYADGVNAWIDELKPADRPIEFKILNYKPEYWSPYKSALIVKYMAWDLDGSTKDKYMTTAKTVLPDEIFKKAFPLIRPYSKPIIPQSKKNRKRNYQWKRSSQSNQIYRGNYQPNTYLKGSNNWIVNGSKSRSGLPILANDPHLGLSLPATWYENQLSSPDCNVYGVSLPGVPMIVIGFTPDVAWGLTYTTSDRIDFVTMELNEEKNQYKLDGKWENPLIIEDTIKVRGGNNRQIKTLFTKFGPIVYTDSIPALGFNSMIPDKNMAMNWTAIAPTLEMITMYRLNRAKNLEDYKQALPYFSAPGQNFAFASKDNDIAIWHNGKFPIRESNQARFVNSTASNKNVWDKFIPFNELPHSINPSRGYLYSANQQPVGPNYKYFLGTDSYAEFERGNRINEVLDSLSQIVPSDFKTLQLDKKSMLAEKLLPYLLSKLPIDNLNNEEKDIVSELQSWNYEFSPVSKSPGIFYEWLFELRKDIWKDEAKPEYKDEAWWLPFNDVTAQLLLTDPLSSLYDNKLTPEVESQEDVILESFSDAVKHYTEQYGSLNESWEWQKINPTVINSLANLPGFGYQKPLPTGGHGDAVNAIDGDHGPSWRMIVSLGKNGPQAFGVYPGGQSGNPGSPEYDQFVDTWAHGDYYELHLIQDKEKVGIPVQKTILNPK